MEIKQVVLEHNWLISPEEHLEALASRDPYPLQTFLGVCGVLDLGDLNLDQALMFIVARNIGSRIESLKIFAGKDRSSQNEQWKLKSNTQASVPETEPRFKDSRVPSDNMDFGMIESADELPLIHRDQFLLLDVAPLEFLRRLNSRELSRDVFYERKTDNPENKRNLIDDTTEKLRSDFSIPKAKALLDISSSMNDKDQRGIIARGSQISFMHNAFLSSIELHFRPFNSEVGSLVKGRDADAFHRIVQKLLRLRNDGETSIQRALEQTAKDDIDSKDSVPTRVDILLVTDGQSRIIGRPQGDAVLHTISIGNPLDSCEDPLEKKMAEENHDRLKKISETFIQLTRDDFTALLKPRRLDVLGLYMLIKSVPKELAEVTTQEQAERIYNRIQIVDFLIDLYQQEELEAEKDDLFQALKEINSCYLEQTKSISIKDLIKENSEKLSSEDLNARKEFERLCGPKKSYQMFEQDIDSEKTDSSFPRQFFIGKKGDSSFSFVRKILSIVKKLTVKIGLGFKQLFQRQQ